MGVLARAQRLLSDITSVTIVTIACFIVSVVLGFLSFVYHKAEEPDYAAQSRALSLVFIGLLALLSTCLYTIRSVQFPSISNTTAGLLSLGIGFLMHTGSAVLLHFVVPNEQPVGATIPGFIGLFACCILPLVSLSMILTPLSSLDRTVKTRIAVYTLVFLVFGGISVVGFQSWLHWVREPSFANGSHLRVGGGFVQNGVGVKAVDAFIGIAGVMVTMPALYICLAMLIAISRLLRWLATHRRRKRSYIVRDSKRAALLDSQDTREAGLTEDLEYQSVQMKYLSASSTEFSQGPDATGHTLPSPSTLAPLLNRHWFTLLVLFLAFLASLLFATSFPPIWNVPFPGYAYFGSPFVIINAPDGIVVQSKPDALWGSRFNLKVYPDTLAFYLYFIIIVVLSLLVHRRASLRRWMHTSLYLPYTKTRVSRGELTLVATWVALLLWWVEYWSLDYKRLTQLTFGPDNNWNPLHTQYNTPETAARTLGHIANFFLVWTLMPVPRNSLWESVFGMSFERALRYHRVLGVAWFLSVTAHMVAWFVIWGQNKVLVQTMFNVSPCYVHMGGDAGHCDNFTVLLLELVWVGVVLMVACSHWWVRRHRFELFYFTHSFAIVAVVTSALHAWTLWFYLVFPLSLYTLDKLLRWDQSVRSRRLRHLSVVSSGTGSPGSGVTHLSLALERHSGHRYRAGQFAFINIPDLSTFEWHPFSISSLPGISGSIDFHIKSMGAGTWTHRLEQLAIQRGASVLTGSDGVDNGGSAPTVRMDGPYGCPPIIEGRETPIVLLVAGGIGITPLIPVVEELVYQPRNHVTDVHLYWTVRDLGLLQVFDARLSYLWGIAQNLSAGVKVHLHLHMTGKVPSPAPTLQCEYISRRPDLAAKFSQHAVNKHQVGARRGQCVTMVCGPAGLVDLVSDLAMAHGFEFHAETFAF